ncbi:ubiquitin domain-containing protein 2-like isoform X2 [Ostrea edulis]|uniref:ubiquitin domain-containing protein 2-like isoform X2 n=1 Tax=Ostrea edulis TaxID=37623 RepID=UPI002095EED1|nr:ubiquitin domain-containing protein 2-like isoform X2 [Ostrea edulis]
MGGCIGSNRENGPSSGESSDAAGRNQPLKPEKPKWKSEVPLTDGQLRSKRDEFWDTAPAFEGRKEIWDALKAAAYALETGDHALAQAIIDGANISLPHGTLMDSYDELGNRYQLPVYALSAPTNLIEDISENEAGVDSENQSPGLEMPVKFRISTTNKDLKLYVRTTDSVLKLKKRICDELGIEPRRQRWYFSGRLLGDKLRLEDAKIPKNCVVQVIVSPEPGDETT